MHRGIRKAAPALVVNVARIAGPQHLVLQPFPVIGQTAIGRHFAGRQESVIVAGCLRRVGIIHPALHMRKNCLDGAQAEPAMAVGQEGRGRAFRCLVVRDPRSR